MLEFAPDQQPLLAISTAAPISSIATSTAGHVDLPPIGGQHHLAGGGTPAQRDDVLIVEVGGTAMAVVRKTESEQNTTLRRLDVSAGRVGLVVDGVRLLLGGGGGGGGAHGGWRMVGAEYEAGHSSGCLGLWRFAGGA